MEAAARIALFELDGARYVRPSERFAPGYCVTQSDMRLSSVLVWGSVVDTYASEKVSRLVIDDFSGTIALVAFDPGQLAGFSKGERVQAVCRVRADREGEIYLAPEIVTKIDAPTELLRRADAARLRAKYLRTLKNPAEPEGDAGAKDGGEKNEELTVEENIL